ncbi:MAG TPA: YihA family ribosome biogenesis GTP-binding protein [Calditrichaeota bacterium]|nr:YihA family ribosome biogenesis GTP-binding protein [Calditrichota bacterium]
MKRPFFTQSTFVKSLTDFKDRPEPYLPEIAFVGRSNVGKSSLLNALLGRKKLALVSSTPGKTRLINYFLINNAYYFVDLPGYGYAKISKKEVAKWQSMIETYLLNSKQLKLVLLLVDVRREPMAADKQMADWLNYYQIPFAFVLTKTDKISNNQLQKAVKNYGDQFSDHNIIPFSVKNLKQIERLTFFILNILSSSSCNT